MGKAKGLTKINTGDPVLDRIQDQLHEALAPTLANPANQMADWRWAETAPTDGTPRMLQLQYRAQPTAAQAAGSPLGVWTTLMAWPSTIGAWSAGQYLTRNAAGTLAWGTPAGSSGSGGWRTAYDVDFTGLVTQNLLSGGDGVKTIDGHPWTLTGSANLSVASVTNGTGIVITCSAAGGGSLFFKFSDISSSLQPWYSDIEVWAYCTLTTPVTNLAWAPLVIGDFSNLNTWSYFSGPRYDTALSAFPAWVSVGVFGGVLTGTLNQGLTSTALTDDTVVMGLTDWTKASIWSGTYASTDFPAFTTLKTRGVIPVGAVPSVASALPVNMGWGLSPSITATSMTIKRILVRYIQ